MGQIDNLVFEVERRVPLFKSTTTMPDGSQLGYNGDPNLVSQTGTPGEYLIYVSPTGTRYQQNDGTQWYKKTAPNTWTQFGNNSGILSGGTINGNLTVSSGYTYNGDGSGLTNLSINNLAHYASQTITLPVNGWINNRQTITVSGVTATNDVTVCAHPDSYIDCANSQIWAVSQSINSLTFNCTITPIVNIKLNLKIQ
jgi:hypothetical protein